MSIIVHPLRCLVIQLPSKFTDVSKIDEIIDNTFQKKVKIKVKGFGSFKSPNGRIVFRELDIPQSFTNEVISMKKKIKSSGLPCDSTNSFKPHITLSRNTFLKEGQRLENLPYQEIEYVIDSVVLMESTFNDRGPNTYTVIYKKDLL